MKSLLSAAFSGQSSFPVQMVAFSALVTTILATALAVAIYPVVLLLAFLSLPFLYVGAVVGIIASLAYAATVKPVVQKRTLDDLLVDLDDTIQECRLLIADLTPPLAIPHCEMPEEIEDRIASYCEGEEPIMVWRSLGDCFEAIDEEGERLEKIGQEIADQMTREDEYLASVAACPPVSQDAPGQAPITQARETVKVVEAFTLDSKGSLTNDALASLLRSKGVKSARKTWKRETLLAKLASLDN